VKAALDAWFGEAKRARWTRASRCAAIVHDGVHHLGVGAPLGSEQERPEATCSTYLRRSFDAYESEHYPMDLPDPLMPSSFAWFSRDSLARTSRASLAVARA
jgi:hypothetical protein